MIIGYARVSTEEQHLDAQTSALEAAGAERIFAEKVSGTKKSRPELDRMIEQLRDGDVSSSKTVVKRAALLRPQAPSPRPKRGRTPKAQRRRAQAERASL